jgi:Glycosyl transferases group 1
MNFKARAVRFAREQRKLLEFRGLNPARYGIERLFGGRGPDGPPGRGLRIILVSDGEALTSEEQFSPFSTYRSELRNKLGVISLHLLLKDVLRAPKVLLESFDVILLKMSFQTGRNQVHDIVRRIRSAAGSRPVVYFDGDDDLCVQWPEILPFVDLYVKKHVFSDRNQYLNRYVGKTNLTDYVHRQYGYSFADNIHAQETGPVASDQVGKIVLGGNIALDTNIMALHARMPANRPDSSKTVDVMFRGNVPKDWLQYLRKDIEPSLVRLQDSYRVIIPQKRVSREEYYAEMIDSKICLSPFGFGEICWRDFEAIICGCLLVKPDMSHVETLPNIFRPFETYVPVRWDYSDVHERCSYYLTHPVERERIANQASKVLGDFYDKQQFVNLFSDILKRIH